MFTLGFIFSPSFDQVLLIHKNRPDWQKGKLNGIGGKIENGEDHVSCMVREVHEETGLLIPIDQWTSVGQFGSDTWTVFMFATIYTGDCALVESKTDEQVEWVNTDCLPEIAISNLRWLLPFCIDKLKDPLLRSFLVMYDRS